MWEQPTKFCIAVGREDTYTFPTEYW